MYLPLACLVGGLTALTFFVVGPLELYLSNINEFWFDLLGSESYLLLFFLALFAVFLGLVALVAYLLPESKRPYLICVVFGLGVALYLQGNFLNGDMGTLNGQAVNWLSDPVRVIVNSVVWILCIAAPILAYVFLRKYWKGGITLLSVMVIVMQLASVLSLGISQHKTVSDVQLSTDQMFTLSNKKNIVVFVLDTMDAQIFEEYVMDQPLYAEQLADFQYFDDAVSGGGPTYLGMPMLLTGSYYQGEPYNLYLEKAYANTNFYQKLQKYGYDTRLCTTHTFVLDDFYAKYVDNAESLKVTSNSKTGLAGKLYQLVSYKYFPMVAKNPLYLYSGEFDQFQKNASDDVVEPYTVDNDAKFIQSYRDQGITVVDMPGAFRLYHLLGAHPPFVLRADGTSTGEETSGEEQIHGVMGVVCEYMDEMRELGLYDESTIVITADHGFRDVYQNPTFLIKPANSHQDAMTVSHAPITFENVLPTLSQAIDGVNDEKNRTVFEVGEEEKLTRYQIAVPDLVKQYYGGGTWNHPVRFSVGQPARDTSKLVYLGEVEYQGETLDHSYRLGDVISFVDPNARWGLDDGFSGTEELGTYTDGPDAFQRLKFAKQPTKNLQVEIVLNRVYPKQQFVTIYFNDHCVYSRLTTAEQPISFVVPKEAIIEGEQKIHYEMSTDTPTLIAHTVDQRNLCLLFKSMTITETDDEAEEVVPVSTYTLGDDIVFTEEDNGKRYFTKGISSIEKDFAWSLGTSGQMRLIVGDVTEDLVGEFQFKMAFAPPQRFSVFYEGECLFETEVATVAVPVTFTIPKECVKDGILILDLNYPDAASPASVIGSTDKRLLAVAFSQIRFYEGSAASAAPTQEGESID